MHKAYDFFSKVKFIGVVISGLAILTMMLAIVADVASRNLTGASILGVYEITQNYLMILAIFAALPFVYSSGIMPKLELLFERFKGRGRTILINGILVLEILVYAAMAYYSWQFAMTGLGNESGFMAGGKIYPLYPVLFVIPISFLGMTIECIFAILNNLTSKEPNLTYEVVTEETYF